MSQASSTASNAFLANLQAQNGRETLDLICEMSALLKTGLDRETLGLLVGLCEAGVSPDALAAIVKELKREAANRPASSSAK